MTPKTRVEWAVIVLGLVMILAILVYCGWRIQLTANWLSDHRAYIQARDERWEVYIKRAEDKEHSILAEIEGHLLRQDGHMEKQDATDAFIIKNQVIFLDHIRREEALWQKAKP